MSNVISFNQKERAQKELLTNTLKEAGLEKNFKEAIVSGIKKTMENIEPGNDSLVVVLCHLLKYMSEDIDSDGYTDGLIQGFSSSIVDLSLKAHEKLTK